jgi:iron complex outermembrane receptor protein
MKKQVFVMSALALAVSQAAFGADEVVTPAGTVAEVAAESTPMATVTTHEPTKKMLGDVVVSASKIQQSSVEAPANVTVFTAKELEKTNNPRLGDALVAKAPGLFLRGGAMGSGRPGATATTSYRGQYGGVAVMVDGMNMADSYSSAIDWSMVSMNEVERVEVTPGAASALYGTGATAGVVSITTKAPTKKEISIKQSVGFGDSAGQSTSASYRNKFDNGLGVVFGLGQDSRDGYAFEYVTKTPAGALGATPVSGAILTTTTKGVPTYIVGEKGKNGYKSQNFHSKLYFDLTPTSRINAGVAYTASDAIYTNGKSYLVDANTGKEIPLSNVASRTGLGLGGKSISVKEGDFYSGLPTGTTSLRTFVGFEGDVLEGSKLNTSIGVVRRNRWFTAASASATSMGGVGTLTESPKDSDTINAMAELTRPLTDNQLLVVGVAIENAQFNQGKYFLSNWTNKNSTRTLISKLDAKIANNSLFVQDQFAVNDNFVLYVGGRYDQWQANAGGYFEAVAASPAIAGTTTQPAVAAVTASPSKVETYPNRKDSAFSPKLSAVYKLNDHFSLKSSLGTAFNAPRIYDLFALPAWSGTSMSIANPDLKPEKAKSFDLGAEFDFAEGGNIKGAVYVTETSDTFYSVITPVTPYFDPISNQTVSQTSKKSNAGSGLAKGVELSGAYPVLSWLAVRGSYSYTDSKITKNSVDAAVVGKRTTNVPKDLATLALDAQYDAWSGVLSTKYVGEVFSNADNSDVVKGVWAGYSKYSVVDLKVSYRLDHNLKVSLAVDNLADRLYYEYYRMPGRSTTLELAGNF